MAVFEEVLAHCAEKAPERAREFDGLQAPISRASPSFPQIGEDCYTGCMVRYDST